MYDKINLFVISTGKYNNFVPEFMESVFQMFFAGYRLHIWLFTDRIYDYTIPDEYFEKDEDFQFTPVYVPKLPWPLPTLLRYHIFERIMPLIELGSYIFYSDVDMKFIKPVGKDIISPFTVVKHFAYLSCNKTQILDKFETNPDSTAFVDPLCRPVYHCGGFWGGHESIINRLIPDMIEMINKDLSKHYIAKWEDESYLNSWLCNNPPFLTLPPNFILQTGCGLTGNTILDYAGNVNFKDWRD
jgi:hypothetical protein